MNKLQQGIAESITGIVVGLMLTTIIVSFAEDGILPDYFVWLFGLVSIVINIVTINSFRYTGLLYTIGWLIGAILMKDILGTVGIIFNIAGPIVIIILRIIFWFKGSQS
jgi:hypothetical protein